MFIFGAIVLAAATISVSLADINEYDSPTGRTCYSATINAGGAVGYFNMELYQEKAEYDFDIDITALNTQGCDFSQGLSYHLHVNWTASLGASSTSCGAAGGHYDPTLACGPSTAQTSNCQALGRTVSQGYAYSCNPTSFTTGGLQYNCEVGDFSGKFGNALTEQDDGRLQVEGSIEYDPLPPVASGYLSSSGISPAWASVVFHCPSNNARLFCGLLVPVSCSSSSSSEDDGLSDGAVAGAVIGTLAAVAIIGAVIYAAIRGFQFFQGYSRISLGNSSLHG
jgi:hypothetical protein